MTKKLFQLGPVKNAWLSLEFKPQDLWIGAYWHRPAKGLLHVWVCLLPCLPVHLTIVGDPRP